jgi:UDP-N-acetylmuramyl pentapeptide phosphotransferase/UDP-N-acetylglucosamine-1-phosphate transferase
VPASAIIPAYQAAATIASTVAAARRIPGIEEIIVVDDGSLDDTAQRAGRAGADQVIRLPRNRGKGAALLAGVDAATHDHLLFLDADLGDSAAQAGPLLEIADQGMAMAVAVLPAAPAAGRGGLGVALGLASGTIRLLTGLSLAAPMSGQRAVSKALVKHVGIAPRFAVEVALTVEAAHVGAPIREICVPLHHDHTGRTLSGFLHRGRQFKDIAAFLCVSGFGLGWPALPRRRAVLRAILWALALALLPALGVLVSPRLSLWLALCCAAAIALWLPCLYFGAVRLGVRRVNYLGRAVPAASGLLFPLVGVAFLWLMDLGGPLLLSGSVVMLTMMAVGLADDLYAGGRQARGFRGHLGALLRGRITTGAVKAAGGFAAGLVAGALLHPGDHIRIVLDALLIALSANLVNLFDLRPGRALKAFGMLCIVALVLEPDRLFLLGPVVAAAVVSGPSDLAGRTMMGDTGSNVLGGAVGLALASSLSLTGCLTAVLLLLSIHLACERVSLTEIISRNRVLRFLGSLGAGHLPPLPRQRVCSA